MILYHNIDEDFKTHKVVVSKLSEGISRIKFLYDEYGLTPLTFYGHVNYPPLYYNFIDEDNDFTPCYAYLQPDDTELIHGNRKYQITLENFKEKFSLLKIVNKNPQENFILYLKSGDDIKIFTGFESRLKALEKLFNLFKKKIDEGKVLHYFYHAYHCSPNSFMLMSAEGKPSGVFAFIRREKDKNFRDPIKEMIRTKPILMTYANNGELI